ncbi:hypothetical protein AGMMS49525_11570 [Bacteroidia bacterium]|nr:hypothetical protein AGMMS49525_11570 [Bacteroidia bacterium]
MRKEYRITLVSLVQELSLPVLMLFFFVFIFFKFSTEKGNLPDDAERLHVIFFVNSIFMFLMAILPLIIYWNHYQHDKNATVIVDKVTDEFIYKNNDFCKKAKISDIYVIRYYASIRYYNMHYDILFFNDDNTRIIITSLLVFDLKKLGVTRIQSGSHLNMFIPKQGNRIKIL